MEHNFNAPFKFMVLDDKNIVRQTVFANDPTITIQDNWIEMPADTDFDPINKVYDAKTKTFSDAQKTVDDIKEQRDLILQTVVDPIVSNALRWEEMSEQEQNKWRLYRRALLDITSQEGCPTNVIWPEQP